jgi:hypothetical protein
MKLNIDVGFSVDLDGSLGAIIGDDMLAIGVLLPLNHFKRRTRSLRNCFNHFLSIKYRIIKVILLKTFFKYESNNINFVDI